VELSGFLARLVGDGIWADAVVNEDDNDEIEFEEDEPRSARDDSTYAADELVIAVIVGEGAGLE
jgi:hypothetical protein